MTGTDRLTDVELLDLGWRVYDRIESRMESLGADALIFGWDWPTARVLHPVLVATFDCLRTEAKRRAAAMGISVRQWESLIRQCAEAGYDGIR